MKAILIFISVTIFFLSAHSQESEKSITDISVFKESFKAESDGYVSVSQDLSIEALLDRYIMLCAERKAYPGWRVQIFLSSARDARAKAEQIKKIFETQHPEYGVYLAYKAPFFKVRVGDFRTKNEAVKFKNKIQKQFSECWIIEDQIYPQGLKTE